MLGGLLILSLSFLAASAETGKHWALIVAGSKGWHNYRHQVINSELASKHHITCKVHLIISA